MASNCVETGLWKRATAAAPRECAVAAEPRVPRGAWVEPIFAWLTRLSAVAVMLVLAGIFVVLLVASIPALRQFGATFLITSAWNPVTVQFGALAPICGTLIS